MRCLNKGHLAFSQRLRCRSMDDGLARFSQEPILVTIRRSPWAQRGHSHEPCDSSAFLCRALLFSLTRPSMHRSWRRVTPSRKTHAAASALSPCRWSFFLLSYRSFMLFDRGETSPHGRRQMFSTTGQNASLPDLFPRRLHLRRRIDRVQLAAAVLLLEFEERMKKQRGAGIA